jgi:hypothetical protein
MTRSRMRGRLICFSKDTKKRKAKETKCCKVTTPHPRLDLISPDTLRELYAFGSRTNWTIGLDRISTSPVHRAKKLTFSSSASSLQSSDYRNPSMPPSGTSHFHPPHHRHHPFPHTALQPGTASGFMNLPPSHHPSPPITAGYPHQQLQQPSPPHPYPYAPSGMAMRYPHQSFDGPGSLDAPPGTRYFHPPR